MAKIWTDGFNTYETEDEAREQAMTDMTWDDVEDYFRENVTFHDFFTRVHEAFPDDFFEKFEIEICEAENKFFTENYREEGEEEDE